MQKIYKPEEHPKGWGKEVWMVNNELYCGKLLHVLKGKRCSIHYHKKKDETFYLLKGKILLELYEEGYPKKPTSTIFSEGDAIHIPIGLSHQFIAREDATIIEISTQHFEDDSIRLVKGD